MKENVRQYLVICMTLLIVVLAVSAAKIIGDKVTKYQSYKSLRRVTRLARPVQALVRELQKERTQAAQAMAVADRSAISFNHENTDKAAEVFALELKRTELLLLSIPETELGDKRKALAAQRKLLSKKDHTFSDHQRFYHQLIGEFLEFEQNMFTYSDDPEFLPTIKSLVHTESYKEVLAQEEAQVVYLLCRPVIKPGEYLFVNQEIRNQSFFEDHFKKSNVSFFESEPYRALLKARKDLIGPEPKLQGSLDLGRSYREKTSVVLTELDRIQQGYQEKLEQWGSEGAARLEKELIWTTSISAVVLLVLVGCFFFLRETKDKRDLTLG